MRAIFAISLISFGFLAACGDPEREDKGGEVISVSPLVSLATSDYEPIVRDMPDELLAAYADDSKAAREVILDVHSAEHMKKMALNAGVDQRPEVQYQINLAIRKIVVSEYLQSRLKELKPVDDDAILKDRYISLEKQLTVPERRKFSHILITEKKKESCQCDDDKPVESSEERIKGVIARLESGESFEELAQELSEDRASAVQGGAIDQWINKDTKVEPAFFRAGFRLNEIGEISPPVKTAHGYHLIRLDAREDAHVPPFEDVRATVQATLFKQQQSSLLDEIKSSSYPNLETLDVQALMELIATERDKRQSVNTPEQGE